MGYRRTTGYLVECDGCGRRYPDGGDGVWGDTRNGLRSDVEYGGVWFSSDGVVPDGSEPTWCIDCVTDDGYDYVAPDGSEVLPIEEMYGPAFSGASVEVE